MKLETRKLGDISNITTGLVVKRKQADLPSETVEKYKMLTLKSFEQDGWLNTGELEDFNSSEELDEKYLTQEGDVIIRLSHPNTAIVIRENQKGILISSLFAIIRLNNSIIFPEYLGIYLNADLMKKFYGKTSTGSTIQIIKTSLMKDIVVSFPAIGRQKRVIEINKLMLREKMLLGKLIEEKTKYNNQVMKKLLTGGIC